MNRSWLILCGNMVTSFGNSMYVVALFIFASDVYPDPLSIGLIQSAAYLPIVFFSIMGGRTADRFNRPFLIAGTDIARSIFLLTGAVLIVHISGIHPFVIILPMVFMNAVMQAFFSPAIISLILDQKKSKRDLLSIRSGSGHLASLSGQAIGAFLYPVIGLVPLLIINSFCFLLSGISEMFLKEIRTNRTVKNLYTPIKLSSVINEFIELEKKGAPVLLYFGTQAVNSMVVLNLPFFITRRLGFDSMFIGFSLAGLLGGSILAGFVMGITGYAARAKSQTALIACGLASLVYFLSSSIHPSSSTFYSFILPLSYLVCAGALLGWIHLVTIHQVFRMGSRSSAASRQGFLEAAAAAVLPVSYIISGIAASHLPLDTPWVLRTASAITFMIFISGIVRIKRRKI